MIVVVTKKGVVIKVRLKDLKDKTQFKLSEDDEVEGYSIDNCCYIKLKDNQKIKRRRGDRRCRSMKG